MGWSWTLVWRDTALLMQCTLRTHFQSQNCYLHLHVCAHCNSVSWFARKQREYLYLSGKVRFHGFVKHLKDSELNIHIVRIPKVCAGQQFTVAWSLFWTSIPVFKKNCLIKYRVHQPVLSGGGKKRFLWKGLGKHWVAVREANISYIPAVNKLTSVIPLLGKGL